jgi:hypothetical protein
MLPDRVTGLLNAYLDGELTPRQRKAVHRLLRRSPDARTHLRHLQENVRRLRCLPRQTLGPDFPGQVVQAIADRNLRPARRPVAQPVARPLPAWVGLAVAASLLFLVGAGSYVYFVHSLASPPSGSTLAHNTKTERGPEGDPNGSVKVADGHATDPSRPGEAKAGGGEARPGEPKNASVDVADASKDKSDPGKLPADGSTDPVIASPIPKMELFPPKAADGSLPLLILKFGDLDAAKLKEELGKDSGFRLELPVRESAKAMARLQAVCQAANFNLMIEQDAAARLKQPKLHTNFVLYCEDLSTDDLVKLLQQVAAEDKKAEAKKKGDGEYDGLVVTRMSKDDRKELSDLLGIDPKQVQGPDPRVPVSSGTGDAVVKSLTGGGTPRPETGKATPKQPDHVALVLPYNPVRPRPGSAEVKRFLEGRKPSRNGALQVLLVLRETGS